MNERELLEITEDPGDIRYILQNMIDALTPGEGLSMSWPVAQAVSKLKEARFWLGEEMFGGK